MVAQKIQDLGGDGKADSSLICSTYPFRHKSRLRCAKRKGRVYGDWAMQHLDLYVLYVCFVFVFTTNLILSIRHYFFYGIHFKNFERSKLDA